MLSDSSFCASKHVLNYGVVGGWGWEGKGWVGGGRGSWEGEVGAGLALGGLIQPNGAKARWLVAVK